MLIFEAPIIFVCVASVQASFASCAVRNPFFTRALSAGSGVWAWEYPPIARSTTRDNLKLPIAVTIFVVFIWGLSCCLSQLQIETIMLQNKGGFVTIV